MTMTANQIMVEQPPYDRMRQTPNYKGENIFIPLGDGCYCMFEMQEDAFAEGASGMNIRAIRDEFFVKVFEGAYFHSASGTPPWGFGAGAGAWSATYSAGWNYWSQNGSTKPLTLAIPAGTTALYLLGYPLSGDRTAALSVNVGTLVVSSISNATSWGSGSPTIRNWLLVARNCGGGTLTITPTGTSNIAIIGAIAVNQNVVSTPDVGVYDPGSMSPILTRGQAAVSPLRWSVNGGAEYFWGEGGHWTGATGQCLAAGFTESQILDKATVWAPAANTHVRTVASAYRRILSGIISAGTTGTLPNLGTYVSDYLFTPSGLFIDVMLAFNSNAVDNALVIDGEYAGGYCAQWGLSDRFTRGRRMGDVWTEIVGPWATDTEYVSAAGNIWQMTDGKVVATHIAAGGPWHQGRIIAKASGDFPKIYQSLMPIDFTDTAVTAGQIIRCTQSRLISLVGRMEYPAGRR